VGDPNPKTLLGISSTLRYKKFSLIANMNGSFGQDIFNNTLMSALNVGGINAGRNIALSVYQEPVKESFANPVTPSSRFIQNGDYLKMANLTVSYNIGDVAKTFKEANVYVTAQNLFIITNYPGFDPEVNVDRSLNSVPSLGIDYARYPSSRSIIFGINFSL
jgi:TonB-dependent starch-binding outer membrane protein SusC